MKRLLSTKEVAQFLDVNEKMVYTLIAEKGLPSTKITGKWLFLKCEMGSGRANYLKPLRNKRKNTLI